MPRVTFVVPCYNLAHLLPECLGSILGQTYGDFEVLVMDDQSPDNTPEVVRSFGDPRIVHVRNEINLRHLRNYNKGIAMARGEFLWLLSADDGLRSKEVLEKYVRVLDANPGVGYAFCPAMALTDGEERGVLPWTTSGSSDFVVNGRRYLTDTLLSGNRVCAAAPLARMSCYAIETFPLDMPYAGDWYLWCLFALHADVAYFAEPMVHYRLHATNMTTSFSGSKQSLGLLDELRVLSRMRRRIAETGDAELLAVCDRHVVRHGIDAVVKGVQGVPGDGLAMSDITETIAAEIDDERQRRAMLAAIADGVGDHCYWKLDDRRALDFYALALRDDPGNMGARVKSSLLRFGRVGRTLRTASSRMARHLQGGTS